MKFSRYIWTILFVLSACIEEFPIETGVVSTLNAEDILVVEATLTDKNKIQEVFLRRGMSFANDSTQFFVQNATVSIEDDNRNIFQFTEASPGYYISQEPFAAWIDRDYQLNIEVDGQTYRSQKESFQRVAEIQRVYAEQITNDLGEEGVAIYLDTQLSDGQLPLLRYKYEETYQIIAPLWSPFDMVVLDPNPPYAFGLEPREQEERVCYGTQFSNRIIQNDNIELSGNTVEKVLVRFISKEDPIISHRYSISVDQLVQSSDGYAFYEALNELSSDDNVFSDVQPGFIEGNISNIENPDERVLGYFEVVSQSTNRIFFNYEDLFPDEEPPPYFISCSFLSAPPVITPAGNSPLKNIIDGGEFIYVRETFGAVILGGPYFVARRACGDCTALGSNVVPKFWTEE
ncbi:MAG: DUF4249 domain-containing protein [Croceivirga sp.]